MENRQIIVKYMGGLGNQMFQYAIGEMFKAKGCRVLGDIGWYKGKMANRKFLITEIFHNVSIEYIDEEISEEYERRYRKRCFLYKLYQHFFFKNKLIYYERCPYAFDKKVLEVKNTLVYGYWQSYKYYENIRKTLLRDFEFSAVKNQEFIRLQKEIVKNNIASIHVRGGDYQKSVNKKRYGDYCNSDYYLKAIGILKKSDPNVVFWGFTDDLEYAKRIVGLKDIKWLNKEEIEGYQDWMDMYLMSLCKYNILANSSFSWWAAYLNQNNDKIVIAPREWYNLLQKDDVCPEEWIRL